MYITEKCPQFECQITLLLSKAFEHQQIELLSSFDLARWPFPAHEKMYELFLADLPDQQNYIKTAVQYDQRAQKPQRIS